jgi:hypothetical protein
LLARSLALTILIITYVLKVFLVQANNMYY